MPAGEQDLGSLWNFTFRADERPKGEERGESWVRFVIFTFRAGGTPDTGVRLTEHVVCGRIPLVRLKTGIRRNEAAINNSAHERGSAAPNGFH